MPFGCKSGSCQTCILKCLEGEPPSAGTSGLDQGMKADGCFMSCVTPATSVSRISLPGSNMPQWKAELKRRAMLSEDVLQLIFTTPEGFPFRPGRFVHLEMPDGLRRSYSIATRIPPGLAETEGSALDLEFHVRTIPGGKMSEKLQTLEPGHRVILHGPLGCCFYSASDQNQPILMVASGTGLAPLAAIATHAMAMGHTGRIALFHGAAIDSALYFVDEMRQMERDFQNFRYTPCARVSSRDDVSQGSPLDFALKAFPNLGGWRVYTCGHPDLVAATKRKAFIAGADLRYISADSFADQSTAAIAS